MKRKSSQRELVERIIERADQSRLDMCGGYPSANVIENGKVYWANYDAGKEYNAVELIVMPIDEFIKSYDFWLEEEAEDSGDPRDGW
jgi:hypothetical protein